MRLVGKASRQLSATRHKIKQTIASIANRPGHAVFEERDVDDLLTLVIDRIWEPAPQVSRQDTPIGHRSGDGLFLEQTPLIMLSCLGLGTEDKGSLRGLEVGDIRIHKVTLDEGMSKG